MPKDVAEGIDASSRQPALALFDFDGTLTLCDSLLPFLRFAVGRLRLASGLATVGPWLLGWKLGLIGNESAKQRLLGATLAGESAARLAELGARFGAAILPRLVDPAALRRLRAHQRAGHAVWIVSASPALYLVPWARSIGVQQVIASGLAFEDGRCTGSLAGGNCFGPEKVRRLEAELGPLSAYTIYAYGDSEGDREMLSAATHGHLRRFHARRRRAHLAFARALL